MGELQLQHVIYGGRNSAPIINTCKKKKSPFDMNSLFLYSLHSRITCIECLSGKETADKMFHVDIIFSLESSGQTLAVS